MEPASTISTPPEQFQPRRSLSEQLALAMGMDLESAARRAEALVANGFRLPRPAGSRFEAGFVIVESELQLTLDIARDALKRRPVNALGNAEASRAGDFAQGEVDALESRLCTISALRPLVKRAALVQRLADAEDDVRETQAEVDAMPREPNRVPTITGPYPSGVARDRSRELWQDRKRTLGGRLEQAEGAVCNLQAQIVMWNNEHADLARALAAEA